MHSYGSFLIATGMALLFASSSCQLATGTASPPDLPLQATKGPENAAITIVLFQEMGCPACIRLDKTVMDLMKNYPEDIRLVFKHSPQTNRPSVLLAHEALEAAAEQGKFWALHDLIVSNPQRMGREDLDAYADQIGLNRKRFQEALDDHRYRPAVERDLLEARGFGVSTAPTLFINGRRLTGARSLPELTAITQEALGLSTASSPQPESKPLQVSLDLSGSPVRGSQDAPITIVEFSDYQCPFCARAVSTVKQVVEAYPGKVRWIFKNFPLPNHPDAPLAHKAALAAGEQGKYWEMHDLIFENQKTMKREDLLSHAKKLKLDMAKFTAALDDPSTPAIIGRDMAEGQRIGIRGTPTFLVNGRGIVGAQPYAAFQQVIEEELQRAGNP
jgi:protein-disulfide isomerase